MTDAEKVHRLRDAIHCVLSSQAFTSNPGRVSVDGISMSALRQAMNETGGSDETTDQE